MFVVRLAIQISKPANLKFVRRMSAEIKDQKDVQPQKRVAVTDLPVNKVIVHPLVLLSVVDHFNRMGKIGNQKRVVGILLGSFKAKGELDISNSFAGGCRRFAASIRTRSASRLSR